MRIAFFGTPDVAVTALDLLVARHEVAVVVTRPPKPKKRSGTPTPSPVHARAIELEIPVLTPSSPREEGFIDALRAHAIEGAAIVAYGHILPAEVLQVAPFLNAHFSLLPAYRGAAPVQRALMDGIRRTGVTVFLLEPTLDTGPILAVEAVDVGRNETAGELLGRLAPIGGELLAGALDALASGTAAPIEQDDTEATAAPKISAEDARIDWARPATDIVHQIRALNPRPGAVTRFREKRFVVWKALAEPGDAEPGDLAGPALVGTSDGVVRLVVVQPEGKRAMFADEWARGARPTPGETLG